MRTRLASLLWPAMLCLLAIPARAQYVGNLDSADCNQIAGWAWNSTDERIQVDIFDGSALIATVNADQFRGDLASLGYGDGFHGFSTPSPVGLLNGQAHTIHARYHGTGTELSASPKTLTCSMWGYFEYMDTERMRGWAWRPGSDTPLTVDLYDGNMLVTTVPADKFRQDLLNGGIGNGYHGFDNSTPANLLDGKTHLVSAKFGGTDAQLALSPREFSGPAPVYQGWLDVVGCSTAQIAGWAWDANQPTTPITVALYDNGKASPFYVATANQFRGDLLNAGIGDGVHGFSVSAPASLLDGNAHTISARYTTSGTDLWGSPKTMTCAAVAPPLDTRRIGVRPTGSYWGAGGEQIDLVSGNLNFSMPLMKALSRGGWGVTFVLSYNSQLWQQDPFGTAMTGQDVGYGFGWKLQAGSLRTVYSGAQVDHYVYSDATGAEYRLDVPTNGVWTSKEGVYVSYDGTQNRLYFPDGGYWEMGALSGGAEQDAGTRYPTKMWDTNGNWLEVAYDAGAGVGTGNSSARILASAIRAPRRTTRPTR